LAGHSYYNEEAGKYKFDEIMEASALLLGRVTYDGFAAAWPTMKDEGGFADRMNGMPKYVVSTTLKKADWNNTTIIKSNVPAEVAKLKEQAGQSILVAGSSKLLQTLMQHNLVDEYRLMVHPVVLGSGKHLFSEANPRQKFKLVKTRSFSTGIVILHYQPEA